VKFLFRSSDGLCLPQALRVLYEGNEVKLSVADPAFDKAGDGLVVKVISFPAAVEWADVVVYDIKDEKLASEADRVRRQKPTLGASELGSKLEHDRMFGIEFARSSGVQVPEVESFQGPVGFSRAKEYLRSKPAKLSWVFKVDKEAPEGIGTYVSQGERGEMLRMLDYYESRYIADKISPNFILTRKIEGVEVSTEAWFNGHNWSLPNHTIERTKFFPGDLGEKVGCCGNVVWAVDKDDQLFGKLLTPLRAELEGKFVGPLDVNVIIREQDNEPVFLEYSPRFGYDAVFALMELFESDFGEFLYQVATGQNPTPSLAESQFAGDVRVTIPPFPAKGSKESMGEAEGVPVFGWDWRKQNRHVHPMEVMLDVENRAVTSGPHGVVLSVTALGESPLLAQDAAYKKVKTIHVPQMRYRVDLTKSIADIYDKLDATEWLAGQSPAKPKRLGLGLWARSGLGVRG
jgi:phosphoribosylamine-glycine ligase